MSEVDLTKRPASGAGRDVVLRPVSDVEPVLDAEIVRETRTRRARVVHAWVISSRIPVAFKPSTQVPDARLARRELLVRAVKAPTVRAPLAVGRGAVVWSRAWHRWVQVSEWREAAREEGKFADKAEKIRDTSRLRWQITGWATLALLVVGTLVWFFAPDLARWVVLLVLATALAVAGRAKDGTPGRKPMLAGARGFGWTMDPEMLNVAFREAAILKRDESLRLVKHAQHDGKGWNITVDLPGTRKASDAIAKHEDLASALALDEICLYLERVRGDGGHAGRLNLWAAAKDPYGGTPVQFPLVNVESWDAWKAAPFGMDARDRKIVLGLVWSNLLIGAKPGMGKTFAARLAASPFVLDPFVQIYAWNGKGNKDWRAIESVAHRSGKGDSDEEAVRLRDTLAELKAEAQRRFASMNEMDDDECPDGKITPEISRNKRHRMPLTLVVIDELQNYTENGEEGWKERGKKATVGQNIGTLLTWLAKNGRALGIVLLLATQRPDSTSLPTGLRSQMGTRFGLKVMDWRDSNIVLGEQMNTRGYDCSKLLGSHLGVGILRPDGELADAEAGCPTVRTYLMRGAEWAELCERGRALRQAAGTLSGQAAGEDGVVDPRAVAQAAAEAEHERHEEVVDGEFVESCELPKMLDFVVQHMLGDDRTFLPTAELVEVLEVEADVIAAELKEVGLAPGRGYVPGPDGRQQVRGYKKSEIDEVVERLWAAENDDANVVRLHRRPRHQPRHQDRAPSPGDDGPW